MMIKFYRMLLLAALIFAANAAEAQVSLPASWDCSPSTFPPGWEMNIVNYYTSTSYTHSPPNACKFENTGQYITVFFSDEPDSLKYYLRGAFFAGGTFVVQESLNGTQWNTLRTFNEVNIPNSSLASAVPFRELLNPSARYVRFYYSNKSAGNVCVDDICITPMPPRPEAEIAVKFEGKVIPSGLTAITGNQSAPQFIIINRGTDSVLNIISAGITGTDASMFSVSGLPTTIAPGDSFPLTLHYTPSGADGTKTATLSLVNNDANETPYILNLYAVKGCCATEPAHSAAGLTLTNLTSYHFRVNFSNGASVPDGYVVLKKSTPITEVPADGQYLQKGAYVGQAQVVYKGDAASFFPLSVVAGTDYYIKVFPYNGYPGYENYRTTGVAEAQVSTPPNMIGTYYDLIDPESPTFRDDLHNLVNSHTTLFYSDFQTYIVRDFASRDTVAGGKTCKVLNCAYSGENYVYFEPFAWTYFSREHAFCKSWMPTYTWADFTERPEYSDYHNLLPVNQNKINSYRNNYPLGKVVTQQYQFYGAEMGLDSAGNKVFEPRDEFKGDAARAMFYMVLCYDNVAANNWYLPDYIDSGIPYGQDVGILRKWHTDDPPDNYEMALNDYIHAIQGNRNPFIDSTGWVDKVDFSKFAFVSEQAAQKLPLIYPNPASDLLNVMWPGNTEGNGILITDMTGRELVSQRAEDGGRFMSIGLENLPSGFYIYSILQNGSKQFSGKLQVIR